MQNFKTMFRSSNASNFPIQECIVPDEEEKDVYHGTKKYICLTIDADCEGYYEILYQCTPYICKQNDQLYFGWIDSDNHVIDNLYNSIHIDDRCVIGFLENDRTQDDLHNEWNQYKEILAAQWK